MEITLHKQKTINQILKKISKKKILKFFFSIFSSKLWNWGLKQMHEITGITNCEIKKFGDPLYYCHISWIGKKKPLGNHMLALAPKAKSSFTILAKAFKTIASREQLVLHIQSPENKNLALWIAGKCVNTVHTIYHQFLHV